MRTRFLGSIVTSLLLLGSLHAQAGAAATTNCSNEKLTISTLTKIDGGWDVSFAQTATVKVKGPFRTESENERQEPGLLALALEVKSTILTLPRVEFNECDKTATIRNWYFKPINVLGFEKNGHLFAYWVWVELMGGATPDSPILGANMNVMFYDTRGNGTFDQVRIGTGIGMPMIPEWVERSSNQ